jgi:hypothetical protein
MDIAGISSQKCTVCETCNQIAIVYCQECEEYLCATVSDAHKKLKTSKDHRVETLNIQSVRI